MSASDKGRPQAGVTLVELLVAMSVMAVVSALIVGIYLAVSGSFFQTARTNEQVNFARQAMSRLAREIRDAQGVRGGVEAPVPFVWTAADEIQFYTTFNTSGAADPTSTPRLVRFVYRVTDVARGIGSIYREFPGPDKRFDTTDDVSTSLIENVANARAGDDVFVYWAYNTAGTMFHSEGTATVVAPSQMVSVTINVLVDVNPGSTPNYTDVSTTVNPRNVRQF